MSKLPKPLEQMIEMKAENYSVKMLFARDAEDIALEVLQRAEKLVEAMETIARNEWEYGNGIKVTGSHHTLQQIASEALADWQAWKDGK